jgi:hypothetical protein
MIGHSILHALSMDFVQAPIKSRMEF